MRLIPLYGMKNSNFFLTSKSAEYIIYIKLSNAEGEMVKYRKSKATAVGLVVSFILFSTPHLFAAEGRGADVGKGNLIGFIYAKDGVTPVKKAVVKLKNISNGTVYESSETDQQGIFKVKDIEEGLYIAGVATQEGNYNMENLIGIRANKTAKVALALVPTDPNQEAEKAKEECPKGDWYIPEVEGQCEPGYKWNAEKKRCECEKAKVPPFPFMLFYGKTAETVGLVIMVASSVAIAYTFVRLLEEEPLVSPYK